MRWKGKLGVISVLGSPLKGKVLANFRLLISKNVVISGKTIKGTERVYNFLVVVVKKKKKEETKKKERIHHQFNKKQERRRKEKKKHRTDKTVSKI